MTDDHSIDASPDDSAALIVQLIGQTTVITAQDETSPVRVIERLIRTRHRRPLPLRR